MNFSVGCVIYTVTKSGINAIWNFNKNDQISNGTGSGERLTKFNPNRRFEGEYEIVYTDINGNKFPKLKLSISFESAYYKLKWDKDEKTEFIGIGIESGDNLCAGWTDFD